MRGQFQDQGGLLSYIDPETRIPAKHPLRQIRELVREVLGQLDAEFTRLYARDGRPSIPPEMLLSALLLKHKDDRHFRGEQLSAFIRDRSDSE